MTLKQAQDTFVDQWGAMASVWGVNRSMTQIYALLLIQSDPMNVEDIMSALQFSRGNVSMSMKDLMEWGLVYKVFKSGDRKDYFEAEKDLWIAMSRIIIERKRKELDPMMRQIERLRKIDDQKANPDKLLAFNSALQAVYDMGRTTDNFLSTMSKIKKTKVMKWINKLRK